MSIIRSATVVGRTRYSLHPPWITISIIGAFLVAGLLAPWLTSHDPYTPVLASRLSPPSPENWLGTDALGRDLLTRMIFGARTTLIVVAVALSTSGFVGILLGMLAGYFRGLADSAISRLIDSMLAFPSIFFGLLLAATRGPGVASVVIAVSLVLWARFARVIRADVLRLRELNFVAQAKVNGCSVFRLLRVHILPNLVGTIMVLVSINMGYVILLEASLSFLGAGIPPPTPSWGGMISAGQNHISSAWWISVVPGVAIVLIVLAFNLLGDWMREKFDPRLKDLP